MDLHIGSAKVVGLVKKIFSSHQRSTRVQLARRVRHVIYQSLSFLVSQFATELSNSPKQSLYRCPQFPLLSLPVVSISLIPTEALKSTLIFSFLIRVRRRV